MARAGRMWEATRDPFLGAPLDGARGLLRESRKVGDLATIAPWLSLRQLGRRYLKDARLRMLLDRYATYTGSDPRRAPAALATVPYVEQTYGAWYVDGGLRALVDAVAQRATDLGAEIRTGADVAQVIVKDAPGPVGWRTTGVRLRDGSTVEADVVVSNADAAHTYHELLSGPPGELGRRRLRKADPSLSGFVLLLALRGRTPDLQHHTVLFPADYDDEFDSVFGTGRHRGRTRPAPGPDGLRQRPRRPGPAARRRLRGLVRAGQRAAPPPRRARPRGGLARRRPRRGLRRPGPGGHGRARPRRPRPGAVARRAHAGGPGVRRPAASAGRSTAARATAPGRRSCARPTRATSRACSSWAARRTPAAASRWWG